MTDECLKIFPGETIRQIATNRFDVLLVLPHPQAPSGRPYVIRETFSTWDGFRTRLLDTSFPTQREAEDYIRQIWENIASPDSMRKAP